MQITRRHYIAGLLRRAIMHGSRATILRPLGWLIGILATLVFAGMHLQNQMWVNVVNLILLALGVGLYLSAFAYCLLTDKEALRTEKYSIQKMAMEKRLRW